MREDYKKEVSKEGSIDIGLRGDEENSFSHDPLSSNSAIVESPVTFHDSENSAIASATVPHPSGANLTMRSSQRSIGSATAPVHIIADATTDKPLMEVQYTYDPVDEYPRQDIIKFPDTPHRKETLKFHASASTIMASGSSIGGASTMISDWPDID